jgi:hypothetical protein
MQQHETTYDVHAWKGAFCMQPVARTKGGELLSGVVTHPQPNAQVVVIPAFP